VYAATLSFVGLYGYFIVKISNASVAPQLDGVLISAAAALAGILGSAFALEIGVATPPGGTNSRLNTAFEAVKPKKPAHLRLQQALSLEPVNVDAASWPKTIGIWLYALVAAAVAITYALNPNQTPSTIKALAVAFAGYILALLTAAYRDDNSAAGTSTAPTASSADSVPSQPRRTQRAAGKNGKPNMGSAEMSAKP
jgi:hypothetical protein